MSDESEQYRPESFLSPASEYGLVRAATPDRTCWLYAKVPWTAALLDGADDKERTSAAQQLLAFFDGLASQVPVAALRYRDLLKPEYREFHLLTGSMMTPYKPPAGRQYDELKYYQARYYGYMNTRRQFAVIGVPLKLTGDHSNQERKPFLQKALTTLDHWAYSFANGCPSFDEYLPDAHNIEQIMLRAGLEPFTLMDDNERVELLTMMETWWVSRANASALPVIAENDHLHFFPDTEVCADALKKSEDGIKCEDWNIPTEYPASLCFARSSEFSQSPVTDPTNLWLARLLADGGAGGANAIATSVRGIVEPAKVTADKIRRNYRAISDSIREREEKGREATGEMKELEARLAYKRSLYETPDMPPTILDLSIISCVAGTSQIAMDSLERIPNMEFTNLATANEQLIAFKSMQACSPIRMKPYEMHWSSTCIAGAGASSYARAGDKNGALVGLTEGNRSPVYVSTTTVQDEDQAPGIVIVGRTGSGKSMLLVSLFLQWAKIPSRAGTGNTPCILVNPKPGDDFEDAVTAYGGTVIRVDSDVSNGVFDCLLVMDDIEAAKELAAIMLSDILSKGEDTSLEISIAAMLSYGINHGMKATGTALMKAAQDYQKMLKAGQNPSDAGLPENTIDVFRQVQLALKSYQTMRLIFGTRNDIQPLRANQNLTLINAGNRSLVPEDGADTATSRIQQWVLRMIVIGAGAAIEGRDGMVGVDEAWCLGGKGKGASRTIKEWMRTARSRRFTPVFASQKTQEFIDAGMVGGVSRGFLLALDNPEERDGTISPAKAAERFLKVEDSDGHIRRRMEQDDTLSNGRANWSSLRRLTEPLTGAELECKLRTDPDTMREYQRQKDEGVASPVIKKTVRGAVAYFCDNGRPPVPVEVIIPPLLLKEISTNAKDKIARAQRKETQS